MCYNPAMQIAVITGASSGIGRATAARFGRDGAAVLAVGRKASALNEVAQEVEQAGGRCVPFEADVTAAGAPDAIVAQAVDAFGGLTTLVNAAGIIATGTVENTPDAAWDEMLDINLRAPFRLMRAGDAASRRRAAGRADTDGVGGERVERHRAPRVPRRARVLRQQGGRRSAHALRGAGARRARRPRQRRQSRAS